MFAESLVQMRTKWHTGLSTPSSRGALLNQSTERKHMANKKIEAAIEELLLEVLESNEEVELENVERKIGLARKLAPEDQ